MGVPWNDPSERVANSTSPPRSPLTITLPKQRRSNQGKKVDGVEAQANIRDR